MRNAKDSNSCLFGEELVAYIYGELPAAGRNAFEHHLLDCGGCTAELADISLSRLGVFEWHRDEFLPLETPQFVIPFEPQTITAPKYSWIDALRGLVASPMRFATAGGAFAVLIFAMVFGTSYVSGPSVQVAVDQPTNYSPPRVEVVDALPPVADVAIAKEGDGSEVVAPKREFRSTVTSARIRSVQAKTAKPAKRTNIQTTTARSVPRLGNFDETEDTSLRLADLVANIDTKD